MQRRLGSVMCYLRRVVVRHCDGGLTDSALLERFARDQDEAAFEVLVWRHGPMILGVGERVLHNRQDAEDVLQATFLALCRQAKSIARRGALASWLYRVGYRTALRVKHQRKCLGGKVVLEDVPAHATNEDEPGRELLDALDEELQRLPEKYRTPLVLSYLQGITNREIATQVGCPIGTIFTRLARGAGIDAETAAPPRHGALERHVGCRVC